MDAIAPKPIIIIDHDKVFANDFKTRLLSEGIDEVELSDYSSLIENQTNRNWGSHIWIIDYLSLKGQTGDDDLMLFNFIKTINTYVFILFPPDTKDFTELTPKDQEQVTALIKDDHTALIVSSCLKKGFASYHMKVQRNWFYGAVAAFIALIILGSFIILT